MPFERYVEKDFHDSTLATIVQARRIIEEYEAEGYKLTLRQLYYQFVARDLLPNTVREYNRLGRIVSDARLAGLIDWEAIEDRTRNLHSLAHWDDPSDIVEVVARQFRTERWARQPVRVEVWVEKEALAGVFQRVCDELDVPLFAARGYPSWSEMWSAARQRFLGYLKYDEQEVVILHFGDHDPSGIDMTRDLMDRLGLLLTGSEGGRASGLEVRRCALNMDQVEEWSPPPNPAKATDSRFKDYRMRFGPLSWELDALDPTTLAGLVRSNVQDLIDEEAWEESDAEIREGRKLLKRCSDRWNDVAEFLSEDGS